MKSKSKNKKRTFLIAALALIVLLIILSVFKKDKATPVTVSHPVRKTIVETIPANGKIKPVTEVKISPDVSGEIIELNVKEGDAVKKGDMILKIKQDVYISAVESAEASLNASKTQFEQQKAKLATTRLSYLRSKQLHEQKVMSDADFESAESEYKVAKEVLKSAKFNIESYRAQLKEAQENLKKTVIYAPMPGIVSSLEVEQGERVVGTSQMAGTEMLRVADLSKMEVLVDVNENDIINVIPGDTAKIEIDAYPKRKFNGLVTEVANSAKSASSSSEQVTNFEVKILILPSSYNDLIKKDPIPFRPGMSATVSIETQTHNNTLSVPLQAVTTKSGLIPSLSTTETHEQVFIYDKNSSTVKPVEISTGLQNLNDIEITKGITDTTLVVTGPYNAINRILKNGTKVSAKITATDSTKVKAVK
ncbi:MAG: efflux RND transporter periplasmic adaptor subunit [Bacteroidales bacterium]|jgi:HlyD family secretion protein|nr:efflux RND transporter periplasmic adaptor subunit [Bacteroidales bacterium]